MSVPRMIQIDVVADARRPSAELNLLSRLAPRLGLARIWVSSRPPLGPLGATTRADLDRAGAEGNVVVVSEEAVGRWTGKGASPEIVSGVPVLVPSWPARDLPELIFSWVRSGGNPADLVIEVPVSVGRTRAEAEARVEDWFAEIGEPGTQGLFGDLDDCQQQVAALAAAGARTIACIPPERDLADVLAQLSAVGVGSLATHGPDLPPSPAPSPPVGWGRRVGRRDEA